MSTERIDPEVIEAASAAHRRVREQIEYFGATEYDGPSAMEAAIRAADEARGLREEFQSAWAFGANECATAEDAIALSERDDGRLAQVRLVSDWRDVEDSS